VRYVHLELQHWNHHQNIERELAQMCRQLEQPAAALLRDQIHTGTIMGTPGYMAPEQAEGKVHEGRPPADIYHVAVLRTMRSALEADHGQASYLIATGYQKVSGGISASGRSL